MRFKLLTQLIVMISRRLVIYLIYIIITIVVNGHLILRGFYPYIQLSAFHEFVSGYMLFFGWLILIVLGLIGFFLFKNLALKIYSAITFLAGVLWLIAIINQIWYKI